MTATFREIAFGSDAYREECALRQKVLRAPLGLSVYDEDLSVESGQLHFGLFAEEGQLVACVIVVQISPMEAKIRQMAVAFDNRGGGYGRLILEQLEGLLEEWGISYVWMHARKEAVGFYEKLGYATMGPEFIEVSIAHIKMQKYLTGQPSV